MSVDRRRIVHLVLWLLAAACTASGSERDEQLVRARELARGGRAHEAAEIYEKLWQTTPEDLALRFQLAVARYAAGEYAASLEHGQAVAAARPEFAAAWLFVGGSLFQMGETERAIDPLRRAVAANPAERNGRLMLGEALLATGNHLQAARELWDASDLLAEEPRLWYALERACRALQDEALERLDADSAELDDLAADRLARLGQRGKAFHAYRAALDRAPNLFPARRSIIEMYQAEGREDWAKLERESGRGPDLSRCGETIECAYAEGRFRDALESTGQDSASLYWRAKAGMRLAEAAVKRLAGLPPSSQYYELLARGLDERGLSREAAEQWRKAAEAAPGVASLRKGWAASLAKAGDCAAAAPLLEKLVDETPGSAEVHFLKGDCLLAEEQAEAAAVELERAVELNRTPHQPKAALGAAYVRLGRYEEAIATLVGVQAGDIDGSVHYQLSRAYRALGMNDEAKTAISRYRALQVENAVRLQAADDEPEITAPRSAQ